MALKSFASDHLAADKAAMFDALGAKTGWFFIFDLSYKSQILEFYTITWFVQNQGWAEM